jgi:hypothetical protein
MRGALPPRPHTPLINHSRFEFFHLIFPFNSLIPPLTYLPFLLLLSLCSIFLSIFFFNLLFFICLSSFFSHILLLLPHQLFFYFLVLFSLLVFLISSAFVTSLFLSSVMPWHEQMSVQEPNALVQYRDKSASHVAFSNIKQQRDVWLLIIRFKLFKNQVWTSQETLPFHEREQPFRAPECQTSQCAWCHDHVRDICS